MPDTPFKAMGRESREFTLWPNPNRKAVPCEKCGGLVYEGDWPFCRGNAKDHER